MSNKGGRKQVDEFTRKKGVNDRSKDRELEKRQGGHGKGRREADRTLDAVPILDKGDPNYDEQADQDSAVLMTDENFSVGSPPRNDYATRRTFQPCKHSLPDFKKAVIKMCEEYFSAEDIEEVGRSLVELESPSFHYEFVKRVITMSMDRKERERELVSRLLSGLYAYDRGLLSTNQIGKGFERLFEVVDDLELDIPQARAILTQFLARAVVDELLPPSFLSDPLVEGMGGEVVENAIKMLSTYHGTSRVEKVWGPGDGRSVPELKQATDQLLQEYLLSQELTEASRCVKELQCPYFHHEVVKRAVTNALDKSGDLRAAMSRLLSTLHKDQVVSVDQMVQGFDRLSEILPDLVLDTPNAAQIIEEFVITGKDDGYLPKDYQLGGQRERASSAAQEQADAAFAVSAVVSGQPPQAPAQ